MLENRKELVHIQMLGNSRSGSQSLMLRYCDDVFFDNPSLFTQGLEYRTKVVNYENHELQIYLWNDFGFDHFDCQTLKIRLKNIDGLIFVYDITNPNSFQDNIKRIYKIQAVEQELGKCISKIMIGNKIDLEESRIVSKQEAQSFSDSLGIEFIETSALKPTNVNQSFCSLITDILRRKVAVQDILKNICRSLESQNNQ